MHTYQTGEQNSEDELQVFALMLPSMLPYQGEWNAISQTDYDKDGAG